MAAVKKMHNIVLLFIYDPPLITLKQYMLNVSQLAINGNDCYKTDIKLLQKLNISTILYNCGKDEDLLKHMW